MKKIGLCFFISCCAVSCYAQQWEVGGAAGGSFLPGVSATGSVGSATAGFKTGPTFGGYFGQNLYNHLSGEVRYEFMKSDLRLSSGGTEATFSGQAHLLHYDLIFHTNKAEARTQFFAAIGGGIKVFQGTGKEQAYQPLSQFGYFTRTRSLKPMASIGGGVKFALSEKIYMRVEARDFITMFPKEIITPAPGVKFGSLLHDIVPMIGISYEY